MTVKYTKWPQVIPNGRKINQTAMKNTNVFHSQDRTKFTQIGIFGLKIDHLATLVCVDFLRSLKHSTVCNYI
jgi:hypothetical protein